MTSFFWYSESCSILMACPVILFLFSYSFMFNINMMEILQRSISLPVSMKYMYPNSSLNLFKRVNVLSVFISIFHILSGRFFSILISLFVAFLKFLSLSCSFLIGVAISK